MSIVSRFFPKEKDSEYFLLLKIGLSAIFAIIWEVKNEKVIIVGRGTSPITQEDLTEVTDQAITQAEKSLPEGQLVEKVIFGLPLDYIDNDAIKPELLTKLKDLTKSLGLTPLGFIEIPQALSSYLRKKEDSPTSALLVGINRKTVSVSFLRVGKIFETKQVPRSEHVILDIENTIKSFTNTDVLPSRILLYDGEESLDSIKEELMKYPWHTKSSSFLHIPKIEILKPDDVVAALIHAASLEITQHFSEETIPTINADSPVEIPTTLHTSHHSESVAAHTPVVSPTPSELPDDAESMGFVMDVDVAEQKTEHTHEQTVPSEESFQESYASEEISLGYETEAKKSGLSLSSLPQFSLPNIALFNRFGKAKWIPVVAILLLLLVSGFVYAYWNVPQASVKLIVGVETLGKDLSVTIDPRASSVDAEKLVIPGRIIEEPVSAEKTIQTTGEKNVGSPAKGKATIFNKSTSEKSLPKGTVLLANSVKFSLDSDIKIASASDTGEGLTFGKVETGITAASIGPSGNISNDTQLTLADFPSSEFSARAEGALSGGTSRQIDAVSSEDHETLLRDVSKSIQSQSQSDLRAQLDSGEQLLDNSLQVDVSKESYDKDVGDEASQVTLKLDGSLTGIAYRKEDLNSLAEKYLIDTIPSGYVFSKDRTKLEARTIEIQKDGSAKVSAYLRAFLLPELSLDEIRKQITGMSIQQVQDFLKGKDHIVGVEIGVETPFPFGKDSLPKNSSNISLSIASQ